MSPESPQASQMPYVIERTTGLAVAEPPWGETALAWFYPQHRQPHWAAKLLRGLLAHTQLPHHVMGWWFSRAGSTSLIPDFCSTYGVRIEEFEKPPGEWRSFNDFFMRKLRPQVRLLPKDPCRIACPGEGRVRAYSSTPARLLIKGARHALVDFFDDAELAESFEGGSCLLVRLCPSDYHRFHFPCSGTVISQKVLPGTLYSVHPWAERHKPDAWWKNARALTVLQTARGEVACVAIGATGVGSIQLSVGLGPVEIGQEWGAFALGGSALAIFFQPGAVELDSDLVQHTQHGKETLCQVLTGVGTWQRHPSL